MSVRLALDELATGFQIAQQRLAGLVAVQAGVRPGLLVERGVAVQDVDHGQVVPLADLVVVGIVSGCDLHRAGAEGRVHVLVGDDGDATAQRRQDGRAPYQVLVALVVGMHGHGSIAQDRLRPRGGDFDVAAAFQEVAHRPQVARGVLVLHLQVGDGGQALRAPVDKLAAVDEPPLVQAHEGRAHGAAQPLVQGEALPLPVAGGAEPAVLLGDDVAVVSLPGPAEFHEPLAAQVLACERQRAIGSRVVDLLQQFAELLIAQAALDHGVGGDAGVIAARQPQRGMALHAMIAGHQVLQGGGQGVAQVQRAGDVGRWHGDGERRPLGIGQAAFDLLFRLEIPLRLPPVVEPLLGGLGVVGLGHGEFRHDIFSVPLGFQVSMLQVSGSRSSEVTTAITFLTLSLTSSSTIDTAITSLRLSEHMLFSARLGFRPAILRPGQQRRVCRPLRRKSGSVIYGRERCG